MKRCGKVIVSLALAAVMMASGLMTGMPPLGLTVRAATGCAHQHDSACGYTEAADCAHGHDATCGYSEDAAEVPCDMACEDGTHAEGCAYASAVEATPCGHTHSEACGYAEAAPCTHAHDEACGGLPAAPEDDPPADPAPITVAALDELAEEQLSYGFDAGEIESAAEIGLPDTLTGRDEAGEALTIEGVNWACAWREDTQEENPAFDPAQGGIYTFAAQLPEGYAPAEGLALPRTTVAIRPADGQIAMLAALGGTFEYGSLRYTVLSGSEPRTVTLIGWGAGGGAAALAVPATASDGTYTYAVVNINDKAFLDDSGLTSVDLSAAASLESIGASAFQGSGLTGTLILPANLNYIEIGAFRNASGLKEVSFAPNGNLVKISGNAFENTGLSGTLTLPARLQTIGSGAFRNTSSLTAISFAENGSLTSIDQSAFQGSGLTGALALPASLRQVGTAAFKDIRSLTEVRFAENGNLQVIGELAFAYTGLTGTLALPASLQGIGNYAFMGISSLTAIRFATNGSLTEIGEGAFQSTGLTGTLTLPASLRSLGAQALAYCAGLRIVIFTGTSAAPAISLSAFSGSNVTVFYPQEAAEAYQTQGFHANGVFPFTSSTAQITYCMAGRNMSIIDEANKTIYLKLADGVSINNVKPDIVFFGQSMTPASGVAQDFSTDKIYTVTAADGTRVSYTVTALGGQYSISGTVSGGPTGLFNGLSVSVYNQGALYTETEVATHSGEFTFTGLPPGTYTLAVDPFERDGVVYSASTTVTIGGNVTGVSLPLATTSSLISFTSITSDGEMYLSRTKQLTLTFDNDIRIPDDLMDDFIFNPETYFSVLTQGEDPAVKISIAIQPENNQIVLHIDCSSPTEQVISITASLPPPYVIDGTKTRPVQLHAPYTHSIALSSGGALQSQPVGYAPQSESLTLHNQGTAPTGTVSLALSGDNAGSFTLSAESLSSIAAGAEGGFAVTPIAGLSTGTYTATVTATGQYGPTAGYDVSFTVTPATAPGAPTGLAATPGDGRLELSWTTPASDGGSAITMYQYSASTGADDWQEISGSGPATTSHTVTGLANGTSYTVKVRAVNGVGAGAAASTTGTPAAPAGPVYSIELDKTDTQTFPGANVGYGAQAPLSVKVTNTGNQPTGALAVALSGTNSGSFTLSADTLAGIAVAGNASFTVRPSIGLAAGAYTATVTVSGGNGITASFGISFTVTQAPSTYTITATAGAGGNISPAGSVSVNDGGSRSFTVTPDTSYKISDVKVDGDSVGAVSGYTFTGVVGNHTIAAEFELIGPGPDPATLPGAPQSLAAAPGDGQVTLSWMAPASDGGSAITMYQVSTDGGAWEDVAGTTHTANGLTNGQSYSFRVRAVNSAGEGAEAGISATPGKAYSMEQQSPAGGAHIDPNNGKDAVFHIPQGTLADVAGLRINGAAVPLDTSGLPGAITFDGGRLESGSVTVTLYNTYLKTLADGAYSIEILFADGAATLDFTIKRQPGNTTTDPADTAGTDTTTPLTGSGSSAPQTGDGSNLWLWVALLAASLAALGACVWLFIRRRKNINPEI